MTNNNNPILWHRQIRCPLHRGARGKYRISKLTSSWTIDVLMNFGFDKKIPSIKVCITDHRKVLCIRWLKFTRNEMKDVLWSFHFYAVISYKVGDWCILVLTKLTSGEINLKMLNCKCIVFWLKCEKLFKIFLAKLWVWKIS